MFYPKVKFKYKKQKIKAPRQANTEHPPKKVP